MGMTRKISSSKLVEYYYQKDPVFGPEKGEASSWVGTGAEKMGLTGKVDFEVLTNLAHGLNAEGTERLVGKEANHHENAATDIILTVPKSVSIVALNDDKLQAEIKETFKDTAEFAERFVKGRQTKDGVTEEVDGKMIGMLSIHSTSRPTSDSEASQGNGQAIDPHLHGHLCVINTTERPDGTYSTVENRELLRNQALIQQYEYNAVAKVLTDNGIAIDLKSNKAGLVYAEVAGIPDELRDLFSTRHNEIKNADQMRNSLQERLPGLNEHQINDLVQLQTKASKNTDITGEELRANWEQRASIIGINLKETIENSKTGIQAEKLTASEHVSIAIKDINENESKFDMKSVLLGAMKLSVGQCNGKEIETAISEAVKTGELVKQGDMFTTPEMIKLENGIMQRAIDQREQFTPLRTGEQTQQAISKFEELKGFSVSKGQGDAIAMALTTQNRLSIIQGDAGAGKSTAFEAVNNALKDDKNLTIVGLSFQGKAAASLEQSSGIKSQTVDSFLQSKTQDKDIEAANNGHRQLWVVDEASMLGSRHLSALMDKAELLNAQIILVGDTKQIAAIQAGRSMADLIDGKAVDTSIMAEVKRQKTDYTINIAEKLKVGDMAGAFQVLDDKGRITETGSREELIKAAATSYVETQARIKAEHAESGKPVEIGKDMVLMAPTNQLRKEVLNEVREMQKEVGQIQKEDITVKTMEPVNLVGYERRLAEKYEAGNIVILTKNIGVLKEGSELRIAGVDLKTNSIQIDMGDSNNTVKFDKDDRKQINEMKTDGEVVSIDLRRNGHLLSQVAEVESTFSIGERVAWLKNDNTDDGKNLGIKTGIVADITGYNEKTKEFTLMQENGKEVTRDLTNEFITNSQCLTPNKAQGLSAEDAKLVTDTETDGPLLNQKSMYSALTRMEKDLEVFTTDKERLIELASENIEKTSTVNLTKTAETEAQSNDLNALHKSVMADSQNNPEQQHNQDSTEAQNKSSIMEMANDGLDKISEKLDTLLAYCEEKINTTLFNEPAKEITEEKAVSIETEMTEQNHDQTADHDNQNQRQETGKEMTNEDTSNDHEEEKSIRQEYEFSLY